MALTVAHPFVSVKPDGVDASLIQPSNWNATHAVTGTQDVANGGTGANNAGDARTNLGLGTISTQNANNVSITGGSMSGITLTSLDASTTFQDNADPTKQMQFELSGVTGGQTSVLTVPDADGTLALTSNKLSAFAATTSAELAGVVSDETGTGYFVLSNTPTLVTPVLGVATATSINKLTLTQPATGATLTLVDGGSLITAGAYATTLTSTGATNVTLPTTGTLATLAGTEELDNKTLDSSVGKGTWTASGTWTLPALTLGGIVSGGGNQLNNVIIGTTTPLAGSFTTLSASGLATLSAGATFPATELYLRGTGETVTGFLDANTAVGAMRFFGQTNHPWRTYVNTALVTEVSSTGLAVTGTLSATGVTTVAAGAVGAPSIVSTTGTADTGIWFPAADTVAVSTGGVEQLRVSSATFNLPAAATRITGDFSNATVANRVMFQTSTVNARSDVMVMPNGSSTTSSFLSINTADLSATSLGNSAGLLSTATDARLVSGVMTGSGTYLPMTFYTSGSERMRIDTGGNVGIGAVPSYKFHVKSAADGTNALIAGVTKGVRFGSDTIGAYIEGVDHTGGATYQPLTIGGSSISFSPQTGGSVQVVSPVGLGYGTGAGGTVIQATSKSTAVTLNKPTGLITLNNAALGAGGTVSFDFNNSIIAAEDTLVLTIRRGTGTAGGYNVWCDLAAGVATIYIFNRGGISLSEGFQINFAIIKGAAS